MKRWVKQDANEKLFVNIRKVGDNNEAKFWINVTQVPRRSDVKCCSVCVKPVYGDQMTLHKVAEFIAHYRVVGARTFFLYDLAMSAELKALLAVFQSAGIDVTVVHSKLPVNSTLTFMYGQMEVLEDCIYRSTAKSEWFLYVDYDELIMPLRLPTLPGILNITGTRMGSARVGSIIFQSRSYCQEYGANISSIAKGEAPLATRLYSLFKSTGIWGKYIARARSISKPGIHKIAKLCCGARQIMVSTREAVSNHYRRCCHLGFMKHLLPFDVWKTDDLREEKAVARFTKLAENDLAMTIVRSIIK
ncbi:hypothetical protein HPB48_002305 [Haemaphysalis longicornis]|uniref:Glycosyltransferase family 92 protein n=1 Tax=Haemaphysalis longicornis TaxID=44386 RepID=A0A9J6GNW7_HAELO|nr:hypothetical protein HPB48_002305 [Haemaphysalis longicornis]